MRMILSVSKIFMGEIDCVFLSRYEYNPKRAINSAKSDG